VVELARDRVTGVRAAITEAVAVMVVMGAMCDGMIEAPFMNGGFGVRSLSMCGLVSILKVVSAWVATT
jgi:hypothetical protein